MGEENSPLTISSKFISPGLGVVGVSVVVVVVVVVVVDDGGISVGVGIVGPCVVDIICSAELSSPVNTTTSVITIPIVTNIATNAIP